MKFSAVLLAAGNSNRMGKMKGLLPWKGKTLFEHQLVTLKQTSLSEVVVVLGRNADSFLKISKSHPVTIVVNENYQTGKCSSILKGVHAVKDNADALFIVSVDQPVEVDVLNKMADSMKKYRPPVLVPVYKGKRGHPVLFSSAVMKDLLSIREETQGLRRILQKHRKRVLEVPVNCPLIGLNLNTPEDYESAVQKQS
ncbi:nucleotidyltransferase family protein [Pseudalkalibacillus caeni]|uniref:Nucleotidyltransferase family protein n=1 Tax=Exobacillus caeni TaxID=2574798 RepID=A0A5R9F7C1_9BACL|nr:nucleotidyltransferase family protein [Pseudalkalibacillus caeni]TLS38931.1 nucleotidyltransferase family protein [Pseudalkalibacillus caeni]